MKAFIIDTETNDVEDAEPIQLAWTAPALLGQAEGIVNAIGSRMYGCDKPVTFGARSVHHILDSEIRDLSCFVPRLDLPETGLYLEGEGEETYWVGHNIDFDWKALGSPPVKRICTLAMSRAIWPDLDSHKLGALMYFIHGEAAKPMLKNAHDARADVLFCEHLLKVIIEYYTHANPELANWESLWKLSELSRIPTRWPFGKFKGEQITAADRGYLAWCLKQPDMDPYLIEAIKRIY